jgi:hypothetical protein
MATLNTLNWDVLRDIAVAAGYRPDTIRKWRERRRIPYRLRGEFIDLARLRGIKGVRFEDFDKLAKAA